MTANGPSFRRVVRANRLIAEGKCPSCEMDYKPKLAKFETERDDAQRRANLAIGCLEVKEQLNEALRAKDEENKVMHREIIDQGRKVLNATSEIGMSQTEFIEWALERLGEK